MPSGPNLHSFRPKLITYEYNINNNPVFNILEVERLFGRRNHINLTIKQMEALDWLATGDDVLIKSADKDDAVCVWSKEKYLKEAIT